MTEYVEGTVWSRDYLADDAHLEQLAIALRRLHDLPLTGRHFDAVGAARDYVQQIANADEGKVRECLSAIETAPPPANRCLCHNDLVAENIITTPEVRFLDWEYACDNDPLFDLAVVVAHHGLSDRQARVLLDAYFDGDGSSWREQLATQMRLYDALHWLWAGANASPAQDE